LVGETDPFKGYFSLGSKKGEEGKNGLAGFPIPEHGLHFIFVLPQKVFRVLTEIFHKRKQQP